MKGIKYLTQIFCIKHIFFNPIFIKLFFLHIATAMPVAGKFYASHDQIKAESKEQADKVEDYTKNVSQTRSKGPHSKYPSAATENQV